MQDIRRILNDYNIPFVDSGKNVAQGNINIKCPFCFDDPSEHLGISLSTGSWGCWRNDKHRSKHLWIILVRLLGVSKAQAEAMLGYVQSVDDIALAKIASGSYWSRDDVSPVQNNKDLEFPASFRRLSLKTPFATTFINYLRRDRGFNKTSATALNVAQRYNMLASVYDVLGDMSWRYRLILPYVEKGKLLTWTGRSVCNDPIRYLSLDRNRSVQQTKDCVFNYDNADRFSKRDRGETLFVVEGPFDAIKLDFYMHGDRSHAVALSGLTVSRLQQLKIGCLSENYKRVAVVLDPGNESATFAVSDAIQASSRSRVIPWLVDIGANDPGDLNYDQVKALSASLTRCA